MILNLAMSTSGFCEQKLYERVFGFLGSFRLVGLFAVVTTVQ